MEVVMKNNIGRAYKIFLNPEYKIEYCAHHINSIWVGYSIGAWHNCFMIWDQEMDNV